MIIVVFILVKNSAVTFYVANQGEFNSFTFLAVTCHRPACEIFSSSIPASGSKFGRSYKISSVSLVFSQNSHTPGNLGGKEGGDSFLPEGLCAAFGPRWVGTCIRVLLGLQGPAGSADVGITYTLNFLAFWHQTSL